MTKRRLVWNLALKNASAATVTFSKILFFLGFLFTLEPQTFAAPAQGAKTSKQKRLNSQLFEQESETSVSGKVKVIREIQEETEVFLESQKGSAGPYILPQTLKNRAALLKILQRSSKPSGPSVRIEIDDQQRIKSVEENESNSSGPGDKSDQKWEL